MRPQQNRRINSRRSNNNSGNTGGGRHSSNPLTRNYESNGPEVKIRGNARHIADKYLALARDAQVTGDRVTGENYLQHAEHYLRIILAAQPAERMSGRESPVSARDENIGNSDAQEGAQKRGEQENYADMPQPVIEGLPGEVVLMDKKSGYGKAGNDGALAAEGGERPQRRRLPARRSGANGQRRLHSADRGEDAGALSVAPSAADKDETDMAGAAAAKDSALADKSNRLKKTRRPRVTESAAKQV